jgi:hypothetical protein
MEKKRLDAVQQKVRQLVERKAAGRDRRRIRPGRNEKKKAAPEGGCNPGATNLSARRVPCPVFRVPA